MIPRSGPVAHLLAHDADERLSEAGRTILLAHETVRPRAFLLFHGFTASPKQLWRYAQALYERGHSVVVPRLPLHGYRDRLTGALAGLGEEQIRASAREGLAAARALGERVTVAGFSLGGTMALWLALREELDRAVAIAPFFGVALVPAPLMAPFANVLLRLPNRFLWWDPMQRERQMPAHGYPRYPTHAFARLYRFACEADGTSGDAPKTRDVTFVLNSGENSVSNAAARRAIARWRRAGARVSEVLLRRMPPSHDVIEPERTPALAERVFAEILEAIDPVPHAS